MTDLLVAMNKDSGIELTELRVDGGASVSDIMMQMQADMIRTPVNRPMMVETTAAGAAYLAGLAVGFWKDTNEIAQIRQVDKLFEPKMDIADRNRYYHGWLRAVERSRDWIEH
jgi:glycerol kinase